MSEEEIQHNIEQGLAGNGSEEQAYRTVFNALKRQPAYELPSGFADRVLRRMEARSEKSSAREMFWLYAGLVSFVIAGGIAVGMTGFKMDFGALKFISGYSGLLIFGAAFILGLQWIDRKVVNKASL